jgi:hypothetical protein
MATQTLEFNAGSGLTLSCKVFALNSDTVVDTQTATEQTNDKNRYRVAFTDLPAGAYRLNAFVGAVGGFANEVYDVTLSTATFYPRSEDSTLGGKIIGTLAAGTHTAQTGDAFARLGAPAGASIAEDIANIDGGGGGGDAEQATLLLVKAKTDLITSQTAVQQTPALTYQEIVRGDTYDNVANAKLAFTVAKNYTGWTGLFTIRHRVTGSELLSKAVVVTSSTLLNVTLDSTDTAFTDLVSDEEFGPHPFDIQMTSSTAVQQASQGIVIIRKDQTIE